MVALPLLRAAGPKALPVELSRTDTVPVALEGLTVTVRVTVWPNGAGLGEADRITVTTGGFTTSVAAADVLVA
jgi:hypothetical protein